MDYPMSPPTECSSGYQSNSWTPATNSSAASTLDEMTPSSMIPPPVLLGPPAPPPPPPPHQQQQVHHLQQLQQQQQQQHHQLHQFNQPPPLPPPVSHHNGHYMHHNNQHQLPPSHHQQQPSQMHQIQQHQQQVNQFPPQLPTQNDPPEKLVQYFVEEMDKEEESDILTNIVCLLFVHSVDSARGPEICKAMSLSPTMMNSLHFVLTDQRYKGEDILLCYATGNLTNLSKYDWGREAIVKNNGVEGLIHSIQAADSNVVIFAITAIHNLLLDCKVREEVKKQLRVEYIVKLLDSNCPCLRQNYEFKVIVLDCLQIQAYGDEDNKTAIQASNGTNLVLHTIGEYHLEDQPNDELIETASRVLAALSAGKNSRIDIVNNGGINILIRCIMRNNQEVIRTSLWTLRNLSDLLNGSEIDDRWLRELVGRLLEILREFTHEPCMLSCALCILENLTYNNQPIKLMICMDEFGVELILYTIAIALRNFKPDNDILEPAICALCNLLNQEPNPFHEKAKRMIQLDRNLQHLRQQPNQFINAEMMPKFMKLSKFLN